MQEYLIDVEQAREELQSTGSLSLPTRKKLWLALGEVKKNAEYVERTVGLEKRVKLATECVKSVLDIWDAGSLLCGKYCPV